MLLFFGMGYQSSALIYSVATSSSFSQWPPGPECFEDCFLSALLDWFPEVFQKMGKFFLILFQNECFLVISSAGVNAGNVEVGSSH